MKADGPHTLCCLILADADESALRCTVASAGIADQLLVVSPFFSVHRPDGLSSCMFVPAGSDALTVLSATWVLFLNSGDVLSPDLSAEIMKVLHRNDDTAAFSLTVTNRFLGRQMRGSGFSPSDEVRLVRKDAAAALLADRKALLPVGSEAASLNLPLEHRVADSFQSLLSAMNDSTSLHVKAEDERGHPGRSFVVRPFGTFINLFFGQRGYADGMYGLFFALFQGLRVLLASAKQWEFEQSRKSGSTAPPITAAMLIQLKSLE